MLTLKRLPLLAAVLGLTAMLAAPASAGASPGFQVGWHVVAAGSTQTFTVTFRGGAIGRISVQGDGSTDLDLYVYDQNGNLIAKDVGWSDTCLVRFIAYRTHNFIVVVRNRGRVPNLYRIATN